MKLLWLEIQHRPDIIALGMIRQGDTLRKRGRYETALKCFEAAKPYAVVASSSVQGIRYSNIARAHYFLGDEQKFLQSINPALEIAERTKDNITSLVNDFSLDDVLQEQAAGFTLLWKPEKAFEIYQETDRLRTFRPLRAQGSYIVDKARAYLHLGDLEQGITLALKGIQLASEYHSKRHIGRIDKTYNRLLVLPLGQDKRLNTLRDALREVQREQVNW